MITRWNFLACALAARERKDDMINSGKFFVFFVPFAVLGIVILLVVGSRSFFIKDGSQFSQEKKLLIATSFYPLSYFTAQIAGDAARVFTITPAGAEPHDYEPTPRERAKIEGSDILILNGGKFEPWGIALRNSFHGDRPHIVVMADTLASHDDPHIWLDPLLAKEEARIIERAIESADPVRAEAYHASLKRFEERLDQLDEAYRTGLASCKKKDIITSHAAFGYLARRYHFNQIALTGLSPDEEPSLKKLAEVSQIAKKRGVEAIFFESLMSPKFAQTIAREVGAQTLVLNPIEGMTDDEARGGNTYFTEMEKNLEQLKKALQCIY